MSSPTWQDFLPKVFAGCTSPDDAQVDKVFEQLTDKAELGPDKKKEYRDEWYKLNPSTKQVFIKNLWRLAFDKPEERRQLYIDLSRNLDKFFEWQDVENPPDWPPGQVPVCQG